MQVLIIVTKLMMFGLMVKIGNCKVGVTYTDHDNLLGG